MNSHELLEEILPEITLEFNKMLSALLEIGHTPTIEEMETHIHAAMRDIGARTIQALASAYEGSRHDDRIRCECGAWARLHGKRERTVQTTIGTPTFTRAY